ncbi:hypothetical protein ColKHC_06631 [Colletotrichum higginsianum]|nr:hypothetical protein ColKHC_06631 [Colletotrichum higginsianum]
MAPKTTAPTVFPPSSPSSALWTKTLNIPLARVLHAVVHFVCCPDSNKFQLGHRKQRRRRCHFSLKHPDALDLVQTTLRLNGVESATLRVEFFPDQYRIWLKMTEGPVHRSLVK